MIHTDQVLWSDYPWKVVKATLDQRPCAANITDQFSVNPSNIKIASKVEQECQIWRDLKHPNILQFLGIVQDPWTNCPIILMELMEQNLTHFLRSSTDIPYHVQVNISNDIAQAMDYLHRKRIFHRDLTSDNILLNAHYQAKVAGFGKSNILDTATSLTMTLHSAFMPPEADLSEPCCSDKSDCFSIGLLLLYIASMILPTTLQTYRTAVPEIDRRKLYIGKVPVFHGFLPVIRDCLKDKSEDRPSAGQLCQRLGQLKTTAAYRKSLTDPTFQV